MNNNLVLLFNLNHLQDINKSLDKKKKLLIQLLSKNVKARITNFMSITSLYDDIDFKSHFRLTRSSVEVIKLGLYNIFYITIKYFIFTICNIGFNV